jgi:arabinofuranosyltransferase
VALVAVVAVYAGRFLDFTRPPEEDAAMLLRYSQHLAQGHGIVWNVGEPPVEGATDFLFMALVAALHRAGLGLETAARALGAAAHLLTVLGIYAAGRRLFAAGPPLAFVPAAYLAVGPGLRYVTACYGTPLFALTVLIGWWALWRVTRAAPARVTRRALELGLAGVLMGLARPEGALLAVLFLITALLARRGDARALLGGFALGFGLLGLAYFAWRWSYFGDPLPNPYYKKGGGALHWDVLSRSVRNVARLGGPFLAALLAGLLTRRAHLASAMALLPIAGFTALWVLVSDETNYFMRFRYPILPVILTASVPALQALGELLRTPRFRLPRPAWAAVAVAAAGLLVVWQHRRFGHIEPQRMGLYDAALLLRGFGPYTLATTEAGLLPLYSGWRAVDAWGLNDRAIAYQGVVTEEYLDRYRPEVIAFHAYHSPGREHDARAERGLPGWSAMVRTLQRYAESRGYELAAVYGRNPGDTHYYYVRRSVPEAARIVEGLRGLRYLWDGQPTQSYLPSS